MFYPSAWWIIKISHRIFYYQDASPASDATVAIPTSTLTPKKVANATVLCAPSEISRWSPENQKKKTYVHPWLESLYSGFGPWKRVLIKEYFKRKGRTGMWVFVTFFSLFIEFLSYNEPRNCFYVLMSGDPRALSGLPTSLKGANRKCREKRRLILPPTSFSGCSRLNSAPAIPCAQEYKWRELEEQRQAQKLQKQLQQEQAYLLSLQHNQKLDGGPQQQQQQIPKPSETSEQLQRAADAAKARPVQSRSLEKSAPAKSDEPQGPAPDSERIREVTPPPRPDPSLAAVERFLLLVSAAGVRWCAGFCRWCGDAW